MSGTIKAYNAEEKARNISIYSDTIIFPSKYVKDEFKDIVDKNIENKSKIIPQGVFNNKREYKDKKIYLFSHSMGTLVARGYIQKYDNEIEKLVLCGPPTKNELTKFAIKLSQVSKYINKDTKPSKLLNKLTFGSYNRGNTINNEWLSKSIDNVNKYNDDKLCGFIFTGNGFINLYKLMDNAFCRENYKMQNKSLPIFVIAGSEDPVIQDEKKFLELVDFLKELGYKDVTSKLYKDLKHEILNEEEKNIIYKDVLDFFNK